MVIRDVIREMLSNVEHIFNNWDPTVMTGSTVKKSEPNLLGAKTALWADIADMGVTERDNFERILRQAGILSEKKHGEELTQHRVLRNTVLNMKR